MIPSRHTAANIKVSHFCDYMPGLTPIWLSFNKEIRALIGDQVEDLKEIRYDGGTHWANLSGKHQIRFTQLRNSSLRPARVWAIREPTQKLWHCLSRTGAHKGWNGRIRRARRCLRAPLRADTGKTQNHQRSIINVIVPMVGRGTAKSPIGRAKTTTVRGGGQCDKRPFVMAIYYSLGDLNLSLNDIRWYMCPLELGEEPLQITLETDTRCHEET